MTVLLDTNILIDFIAQREYYSKRHKEIHIDKLKKNYTP